MMKRTLSHHFRVESNARSIDYPSVRKKKSPHILMLVSKGHFPPDRRAAATRLHSRAKYWGRLTTVSVVSPEYSPPEGDYRRIQFPLIRWRLDFLRLPYLFPRLLRIARRLDPDIIYVSYPIAWQLLEGYLLAFRLRCPLVVSIADFPSMSNSVTKGSLKRRIFNALIQFITYHVSRKASRIVAVTDYLRQDLIKTLDYPPEKIFVIRNGSEVELFAKALKVKKEFDLVYSGVIDGYGRDPNAMLLYFRYLADLYPSLKILFISYIIPSIKNEILRGIQERNLNDNVIFEDMVSPEELPEYLGRSRLGFNSFIPKRTSCIGAVGAKEYEYLAAGLPVVGLMDPDFYIESKRLTVDNKVGILHQDPKRLAEETAALLKNPSRLRRMSRKARAVGERFDRRQQVEECFYKVILPVYRACNLKG